jgi:glycosyltransferase involved in cell wall biosynthesis
MTVSIVIPCFNHARFLGAAIESALNQSWPDVEVVVVDDGSTDMSASIARRPGVTLVEQPNHGLARARNAGLRASRGDIVIFLDADDRLWRNAARESVAALQAAPAAMMTFGRCRLIDEQGQPLLTDVPRVDTNHYEELLRRNYIWMPAMAAYRRDLFDRVGGFDARVNPSADYDMYLRVARAHPIVAHGGIMADYRQHGANMSRNPVLMLDTTLAVLHAQRPFVRGNRRLASAYRDGVRHWREFYGEHLVERFRSALHAGHIGAAAVCAFHLLRLYPRGVRRHIVKKLRLMLGRRGDARARDLLRHPTRF